MRNPNTTFQTTNISPLFKCQYVYLKRMKYSYNPIITYYKYIKIVSEVLIINGSFINDRFFQITNPTQKLRPKTYVQSSVKINALTLSPTLSLKRRYYITLISKDSRISPTSSWSWLGLMETQYHRLGPRWSITVPQGDAVRCVRAPGPWKYISDDVYKRLSERSERYILT